MPSSGDAAAAYFPDPAYEKYQTGLRRFAAGIIDSLVFMPVGVMTIFAIQSAPAILTLIWLILLAQLYWAYSIFFHKQWGQTLGKMVMRVKVYQINESSNLTWKHAILRDCVYLGIGILSVPLYIWEYSQGILTEIHSTSAPELALNILSFLWFGLEFATLLCNRKRRALHDFIAGTVVIKTDVKP
ncbi:MAG: RDD family protein [Verrucomicrobiota bacterium]